MKKTILSLLLCAFATAAMAQGQEDVVVRRGKYKPTEMDTIQKEKKNKKEHTHNDWYNKVSISVLFGGYNATVFAGNTNIYGKIINDDGTYAVSYERLKKNGLFFYGPGIQVANINGEYVALDLFCHGMIDYKMKSDFLGFGGLHPYAGVSLGLKLTEFGDCYYIFHINDYYYALYDEIVIERNPKLRFYNDIRIGFSINIGKYCTLNIGYKASLTPNYKLEETYAPNQRYYLERKGIGAMQGAEISFRF